MSGALDRDWEGQWVFDAFWETLYLLILLAIMILWRPSENSLRYSYMQQLPTSEAGAQETFREDDDEGYLGNVEREEEDVEVRWADPPTPTPTPLTSRAGGARRAGAAREPAAPSWRPRGDEPPVRAAACVTSACA